MGGRDLLSMVKAALPECSNPNTPPDRLVELAQSGLAHYILENPAYELIILERPDLDLAVWRHMEGSAWVGLMSMIRKLCERPADPYLIWSRVTGAVLLRMKDFLPPHHRDVGKAVAEGILATHWDNDRRLSTIPMEHMRWAFGLADSTLTPPEPGDMGTGQPSMKPRLALYSGATELAQTAFRYAVADAVVSGVNMQHLCLAAVLAAGGGSSSVPPDVAEYKAMAAESNSLKEKLKAIGD